MLVIVASRICSAVGTDPAFFHSLFHVVASAPNLRFHLDGNESRIISNEILLLGFRCVACEFHSRHHEADSPQVSNVVIDTSSAFEVSVVVCKTYPAVCAPTMSMRTTSEHPVTGHGGYRIGQDDSRFCVTILPGCCDVDDRPKASGGRIRIRGRTRF